MKFLRAALDYLRTASIAGLAALGLSGLVLAQTVVGYQLINPVLLGHFLNGGSGTTAVPTFTNCTVVAGSTDTDGECATTSTSATITFGVPFAKTPICIVVDRTSAATVPQLTYAPSTTAITISVVTSAHNVDWHCASVIGG